MRSRGSDPVRIAIVSDIHGNMVALETVLADCRDSGVDEFWFIGDFAAIGPEPVSVLDRVTSLPKASFTRGNTDRYIVTGDRPPPDLATVRADPRLIERYANIAASFAWTAGIATASGWFDWLAGLPLDLRLATPDGTRILAVHASPGTDDGEGVHPGHGNEELARLIAGCDADVVFVGHTHEAMVRGVGSTLIVNLGSVSNPRAPDLRASYVLLDIAGTGIELELRRVSYDHAGFIEGVRRSRHPATEFILSHQRGELPAHAPHADHTVIKPGERIRVSRSEAPVATPSSRRASPA